VLIALCRKEVNIIIMVNFVEVNTMIPVKRVKRHTKVSITTIVTASVI